MTDAVDFCTLSIQTGEAHLQGPTWRNLERYISITTARHVGKEQLYRANKHGAIDGFEGGSVNGSQETTKPAPCPGRECPLLLMQKARLRVCKLLCIQQIMSAASMHIIAGSLQLDTVMLVLLQVYTK